MLLCCYIVVSFVQLYLYEYKDDAELSDRPRQVYPFAVVDFRFQGILSRDASRLGPPILQQQMKLVPWGGARGFLALAFSKQMHNYLNTVV